MCTLESIKYCFKRFRNKWKDIPFSWNEIFDIFIVAIFPKLMNRFRTISIQIHAFSLPPCRGQQADPSFLWKTRNPGKPKQSCKERIRLENLYFSFLKLTIKQQ